jgi:anti-anti-sigma regulatory factor
MITTSAHAAQSSARGVGVAEPAISLFDEEDCTLVKLEGSARVELAAALKEKLALAQLVHDVAIDWSEAEHVDASVLQVFLALRKFLGEHGLALLVDKDNVKVRSYLKLSGLSEYFPLRAQPNPAENRDA